MNVIHQQPAERYLLVPIAIPTTAEEATLVSKAAHRRFPGGRKVVRRGKVVGEVVESAVWPMPHQIRVTSGTGVTKAAELPAGTAYVGLILTPSAWRDWKRGSLPLNELEVQ